MGTDCASTEVHVRETGRISAGFAGEHSRFQALSASFSRAHDTARWFLRHTAHCTARIPARTRHCAFGIVRLLICPDRRLLVYALQILVQYALPHGGMPIRAKILGFASSSCLYDISYLLTATVRPFARPVLGSASLSVRVSATC